MFQRRRAESRSLVALVIYVALLLDNVLLTVIVPILPDYLARFSDYYNIPRTLVYKNFDLHYVPSMLGANLSSTATNISRHIQPTGQQSKSQLEDENASIGILLAVKALVQLVTNPIVGSLTTKVGYRLPIIFGSFNVLFAALIFAFGESYGSLFIARAIQGIGSSCLGVCGMSLIAQLYPEDDKRSKIMGIILGSVALGVLIGYPFGGVLYDFVGKSIPFFTIAFLLVINLGMEFYYMELHVHTESSVGGEKCSWWPLLSDPLVTWIACGIWISTSAMAILEPCLPIWLMTHLHAEKWQLGTVFLPDSLGYLIGTNFFGSLAFKLGQLNTAVGSLMLVGVSCTAIPLAETMSGLLIPHFCLGLGIGALDAALVPLLASAVDAKYAVDENDSSASAAVSNYGAVYAIQQMAVSLAYSVAPILGGELARLIGFAWLMRIIGAINFVYGPFLLHFAIKLKRASSKHQHHHMRLRSSDSDSAYQRFYEAID